MKMEVKKWKKRKEKWGDEYRGKKCGDKVDK